MERILGVAGRDRGEMLELEKDSKTYGGKRKLLYKKKNKKKQCPGRVERLKETIRKKDGEVEQLSLHTQAVKKLATKAVASNKRLKRKLDETEPENIILRDYVGRSNRLHQLRSSGAVGHSRSNTGRCNPHSGTSLLSSIKIINEDDLESSTTQSLGSGQFGTCYLRTLGHYSVCVKVFNKSAFIHEANILSKFTHQFLPYLFGICVGDCPSIVTSFHGINDHSVTLHRALFTQSKEVKPVLVDVCWMVVLQQISCGLEQLHTKYRVLHNDLICDNIVLTSTNVAP